MKTKFEYPEVTTGSILARQIREQCNKWSPEKRKEMREKASKIIEQINDGTFTGSLP